MVSKRMVSDSAAAEALKSEAWAEQPREAQMEMIRFPVTPLQIKSRLLP